MRPARRIIVASIVALAALGSRVYGLWTSPPPPVPVANHAFLPAAEPAAPATVWAVGDGADGGPAARRVADLIRRGRAARMLYLGDVYERGSPSEFQHGFSAVYGRLAARTAPTPGNHDWPAHLDGYDPYWQQVTGAPTPPWYALRIGGWQLLSLNSEAPHEAGTPQLRWLQRQLLRAPGTCTLAFWHRPLMSAGRHGDQPDVAPFWTALRGHARLVLNGHDHDMQRLQPRGGITELVAGAGGHSRYGLGNDPRLAFGDDDHDGALRLRLRRGSADLAFVAANGGELDHRTVRCAPR